MIASRSTLRRKAAVLAALGLAATALTVGIDRLNYELAGRDLAVEFAELNLRGRLHAQPARESDEVVAARTELERLLRALIPEPWSTTGFGTNEMLQRTSLDELGVALEDRANWFARLDALPESLWTSAREPRDLEGTEILQEASPRHSDDSIALHEAVDHLRALAWYEGNRPGRSAEAGHWLARAAALARVTDGGSSRDLHLRVALEEDVLELAQRLADLASVDRHLLLEELGRELSRFDERDRPERSAWCQLRWLERSEALLRVGAGEGQSLDHRLGLLNLVRSLRAYLESDPRSSAEPSAIGEHERATWGTRTLRVSEFLASL